MERPRSFFLFFVPVDLPCEGAPLGRNHRRPYGSTAPNGGESPQLCAELLPKRQQIQSEASQGGPDARTANPSKAAKPPEVQADGSKTAEGRLRRQRQHRGPLLKLRGQ